MQGQVIAGFELQSRLGEGGAGHVWKARQISLERMVAIKILTDQLANNPADIEQFKLEARAAAQLKHTGIVQVYDFGEDQGVYFFAMEYIKGYSVGDWLERKGNLEESDTLMVAHSIAEALGYAWDKTQLIHRDIKPDNVLVDEDGTIKVVDLGLVKVLNADGDTSFESENMCTPNYCSPQQAHGEELDSRTDIYSLGCMMYHMLTGQLPFGDMDPHDVLDQQVGGHLADPRTFNPNISTGTVLLLQKMLAKRVSDRPANWSEVLVDLQRCMAQGLPDRTLSPDAESTLRFDPQLSQVETASASGRIVKVDRSQLHKREAHSRAIAPPPVKKSGAPAAIASILIAVALIGGGLFALQYFQAEKARKATEARTVLVEKEFDAAREFMDKNPDAYKESLDKFQAVLARASGTKYAQRAQSEINGIKQRRKKQISEVMSQLKKTAVEHVDSKDFIAAMNTYKLYAGPFAVETADDRAARAADLEPRAMLQAQQEREALINQSDPDPAPTNAVVNVEGDPTPDEPPPAAFPPEFVPYKELFDQAVAEANAAYLEEFEKVFAGYKAALAKVKEEGQENGIFDTVNAIEREEERLDAEQTLPRRLLDNVPASVKVVMARAAQHRARLEATRNGRLDPIKTKYLNQLRAIQRKLTTEDRINDARVVKAAADELETKSIPLPKPQI